MFQMERFHFFSPPWIKHEHLARFEFAARYVRGRFVVDCACGAGEGTALFLKAGAKKILAFDNSEAAVQKAKRARRGSLSGPANADAGIQFKVSDGLSLPLPDRSTAVYISLETLEHVDQDRLFLKEVNRVLQSTGLFICSTPNRFVTNPGTGRCGKPWNRYHVREYDTQGFRNLLSSFFGKVELYGQNPQPAWVCDFLNRAAGVLPPHGSVYFRQIMKLPLWMFDRPRHHRVRAFQSGEHYEYLIAVCSAPRIKEPKT